MSDDQPDAPRRRSVLTYATLGMGAITVGAGLWGLGKSTSVDPVATASRKLDIPLDQVGEGTQLKLTFDRKPVFVTRLSQAQLDQAYAIDVDRLHRKKADNQNLPDEALASVPNRSFISNGAAFVVLWGVCPRRGCVPLYDAGDYGGWFCPCGAAHFDTVGRFRKGPGVSNMLIPRYELSQDNVLTVLARDAGPTARELDQLYLRTPKS